ncbi:MAG: hypothetical protein U0936_01845 [Planctomycetaceae bacterium]
MVWPGSTLARQEQLSLWEYPVCAAAAVVLMSAEWALRKGVSGIGSAVSEEFFAIPTLRRWLRVSLALAISHPRFMSDGGNNLKPGMNWHGFSERKR